MTSISPRREHAPTCRHVASSASHSLFWPHPFVRPLRSPSFHPGPHIVTTDERSGRQGRALRAPAGLGLDGREHGDNIRVRRGSEYSIRTLQNADEKHGASTDFLNRCTWYLIPRGKIDRGHRDTGRVICCSLPS